MLPPEMKRLKQLEEENARLKKIVPDLTLYSRISGHRAGPASGHCPSHQATGFGSLFGAGVQYGRHRFHMLIDPIEHFRRNNVALRQMPPVLVYEFDGLNHYLQDGRLRKPFETQE